MKKPRLLLPVLCTNQEHPNMLRGALRLAPAAPFERFSSEDSEYLLLLSHPEEHQEGLCWFGARAQGLLLLLDAEVGLTETLKTLLSFIDMLRLPIAAVVLIPSAETDDDWLEMIEAQSRRDLEELYNNPDSIAYLRWRGDGAALVSLLDAFSANVTPLDLKPLRVELLSRRAEHNAVIVTGLYWQGSIERETEYELVGIRPTKRVHLELLSPPNPTPGSLVKLRLFGVQAEELCLGQVLATPGSIAAERQRSTRLWRFPTPRSILPDWLSEHYPASPTEAPRGLSFFAGGEPKHKDTYSVQVGPLYMNAPGTLGKDEYEDFWAGTLTFPRANLIQGELIWYMKNEKDPLAQHPATEDGTPWLYRKGGSYWGLGFLY